MKETLILKQQVLSRQSSLLQEKIDRLEEQKSQLQGKWDRLQFEITKLESLEIKKKQPDPQPQSQNSVSSPYSSLMGEDDDWEEPVFK